LWLVAPKSLAHSERLCERQTDFESATALCRCLHARHAAQFLHDEVAQITNRWASDDDSRVETCAEIHHESLNAVKEQLDQVRKAWFQHQDDSFSGEIARSNASRSRDLSEVSTASSFVGVEVQAQASPLHQVLRQLEYIDQLLHT
jgi:hypothetical protein